MDGSRTSLSLLQRAASSEPRAWQQFAELYAPLVHEWLRQQRVDSHTASDIAQDVFSAVHVALPQFKKDPENGSFRGWLWTITRNKLLDYYRKNKRQPNGEGGSTARQRFDQIPDEVSLPVEDPTTEELHCELLHRAITQVQGEFRPRTWQAFWRSSIDGIATDLVAEELGMQPASVRQARSRVLRRLRCQLGETE